MISSSNRRLPAQLIRTEEQLINHRSLRQSKRNLCDHFPSLEERLHTEQHRYPPSSGPYSGATPTVTVTSPTGGENWTIGSNQTVTSTSTGSILSYHFEFSTNNGSTWQAMGDHPDVVSSDNSVFLQWTVPNQPSSQCRARVTANYFGGSVSGSSPNTFTIAPVEIGDCPRIVPCQSQLGAGNVTGDDNYDSYRLGVIQRIMGDAVCSPGFSRDGPNPQGESIRDGGCFLTAFSMLMKFWAPQFAAITPPDLNAIFVNNNVFDGDNIDSTSAANYFHTATTLVWRDYSGMHSYDPNDPEPFNQYLMETVCGPNGVPVVVQFPNHFVVVTGHNADGFQINDPGRCPVHCSEHLYLYTNTTSLWGLPTQVRGILVPADHPILLSKNRGGTNLPGPVRFAVDTNAEILVIDPSGNRTGYDPVSGAILAQIPRSSHFVDFSGDAVTEQQPVASIHTVSIGESPEGIYEVQVIGQNDGLFELEGSQSLTAGYTISAVLGSTHSGSVTPYLFQVGGSADLSATSSASANSVNIGDVLTYTMTATNSGSTATGVTLIDSLPAGLSLVSVDGALYRYDDTNKTITIALENMAAGASETVTIVVVVAPIASGTLTNTAVVSSMETDINPADNSTSTNVTVTGPTLSVVSRKTHGSAGDFDIHLPLTATAGIECRTGDATDDYQLVLTFPGAVNVEGTPQAEVTSGTGIIGSGGNSNGGAVTINGNVVTVPLTDVANAQTIGITLYDVNEAGNVVIPMSILIGDTNGDGRVDRSDLRETRARIGQILNETNFRSDVDFSGAIDSTDLSIVTAHLGTGLGMGGRPTPAPRPTPPPHITPVPPPPSPRPTPWPRPTPPPHLTPPPTPSSPRPTPAPWPSP